MRPARSTLVLLALLLANAWALLFFRFFITVDGPIHVLQASLSEGPWPHAIHSAQGIVYDHTGSRSWFGDTILRILLIFLSPVRAHDVFAVVVTGALVLGALAFMRAHGTRLGMAALWLAPISFNLLLIMGMFHFLLGIAVAFAVVAWWSHFSGRTPVRWAGLIVGVGIAWYTHRSALILLGLLFLFLFLFTPRAKREPEGDTRRASPVQRIGLIAGLVAVGVAGALRLAPLLRWVVGPPEGLASFVPSDLLRPLVLLDRPKEMWTVHAIGLLLLVSVCIGLWARWRMGRKRHWHDALLVLFLALAGLSALYGTHAGHKAFIAERSQFLAILMAVLWLAAIADARKGWVARVIGGAAVCALPLHIVRLVRIEEKMAPLRETCLGALEAGDALAPGALVVPWVTDPHPLLQHVEAYVALGHDGILVAPDEHIRLVLPRKLVWRYWLRTEDRAWLIRQWRKGVPQEVDQILFIGKDLDRTLERHPWPSLLQVRFRITYDNGQARICSAERAGVDPARKDGWGTFLK